MAPDNFHLFLFHGSPAIHNHVLLFLCHDPALCQGTARSGKETAVLVVVVAVD
jgi:hypothetical protein